MTDASYDDVIRGRRSIRGFLAQPVPPDLIRDVLALAMCAPSSLNTQPWNFTVVTGAILDQIRAENAERTLAGVPSSREFRFMETYHGVHRERQVAVGKQIYGAMGIAREDRVGRKDWVLRGFRQFDAPVAIIVTYDRVLHGSDIPVFDCGAVTNGLVNAAWSRGLGCVINSQGILHSPVLRDHAGIAPDQVIMICVAMGFPDPSFPTNAVVTPRKSVDEAARFIGFPE